MRIARLRTHPTDPDIIEIHTDPDCATLMGRYGPARYTPTRRAYLIHITDHDQFATFARVNGIHLTDERATHTTGKWPGPLPECERCAQPYPRKTGPGPHDDIHCAECGHTLELIQHTEGGQNTAWRKLAPCAGCGRDIQLGRGNYCACGTPIPRAHTQPLILREQLPDPVRIADVIPTVLDAIDHRQEKP